MAYFDNRQPVYSQQQRYISGNRIDNDVYTRNTNNGLVRNGGNSIFSGTNSTYDTELTYSRGGCAVVAKYSMFAVNIVFAIAGAACLALGFYLRVDERFRDFLSERYRQAVPEAFWQAPTLFFFSYILIVFGAVSFVISMFGFLATCSRSKCMICIYGLAVFILLIFTVMSCTYLIYKKDGIDVELSDALNYMVQHYYQGPGIVQESLDRLQMAFRCCGNAGCSDFVALRLDVPRSCDIRCDSCHERIWIALGIGASVAFIIFGIVIIGQILALIISWALLFTKAEEDDEELVIPATYVTHHRNQGYMTSPKYTVATNPVNNYEQPKQYRQRYFHS